jgi:uncharacterized protein YndB with AHSA1/START domain
MAFALKIFLGGICIMESNLIARAETDIDAPRAEVWKALTDPEAIKEYMFGADVESDWHEGSPITWKGEWQGKPYEDKGEIMAIEPEKRLEYSHFSQLSGQADRPENYHIVTIELSADGNKTHVSLSQDKNETEESRQHSEKNWNTMLSGLKKYVEH